MENEININIEIVRGDNRTFKFQRKTAQGSIITDIPSEMYITFKPNDLQVEYVIQKVMSKNEIEYDADTKYWKFELEPEDTNNLTYDNYLFDIEIITEENKVKTICEGILTILPEITFASNEGGVS